VAETYEQGTQPRFGQVWVGVMRTGYADGQEAVQLLVRGPAGDSLETVPEGGRLELSGEGVLSVLSVSVPEPGKRGSVEASFEPFTVSAD
jgi:hypothetical protein